MHRVRQSPPSTPPLTTLVFESQSSSQGTIQGLPPRLLHRNTLSSGPSPPMRLGAILIAPRLSACLRGTTTNHHYPIGHPQRGELTWSEQPLSCLQCTRYQYLVKYRYHSVPSFVDFGNRLKARRVSIGTTSQIYRLQVSLFITHESTALF